jgi:hypothetical protein
MDEKELRLKCIEFAIKYSSSYNFPVYQMMEAELLYNYISNGTLPTIGRESAQIEIKKLLNAALDELIKERQNCNQATNSGNPDPNCLETPKPFIDRLLSKLRRE